MIQIVYQKITYKIKDYTNKVYLLRIIFYETSMCMIWTSYN